MKQKFNYKKVLTVYVMVLMALWLSIGTQTSYAQTPQSGPTPTTTSVSTEQDSTDTSEVTGTSPTTPTLQATSTAAGQSRSEITEVTLAQLDQPTFELRSPIQQETFSFDTPFRWNVAGESSYLELYYDMEFEGFDRNSAGLANATVNVYYNEILVGSFAPSEGFNQIERIPISSSAIAAANGKRQTVSIVYFSGDCETGQQPSLFVVQDQSKIHFDYELLPVEINLADFPYPVAQNVFEPDHLLIVIPDDYSDVDLSTAASVAATMGLRTFGNVTFDVVTASEATPEKLVNTSAIIVGQPEDNAFLLDLYQRKRLPTTLTADSLIVGSSNQVNSPDDGVIQEIFSDYSNDHVYLIVTGATDLAVTRAAQALSVLAPRYGFEGDLVVIADFQELVSEKEQTDTFSLADLGFEDTTFYGIGSHDASLSFFVPPNWRITEQPTLSLSYFHSNALESAASGVTISLNDQPVGSAPLGGKNQGERQVTIRLPESEIKTGVRNKLTFEALTNLELPECVLPELDLIWFRINDSSQLELPHEEVDLAVDPYLDDPLQYFISREDLSDVWFSLPTNPTHEELLGMINTAAWLGNLTSGPGFAPRVSRGPIDDLAELDDYHLIAFGLPTTNPVIAKINDKLPQPFVPGENYLRQQVGNVVYGLPDNFDLGLIQILPAPWSPDQKAVMIGTGTSPKSEQWAINTLTDETDYYNLDGNVAFITTDSIETFDSRELIRAPLLAAKAISEDVAQVEVAAEDSPAEPAAVSESEPTPAAPVAASPKYLPEATSPIWVTQLTFGLIGAGLVIATVGGFVSWRKKK